MTTAPHSFPLSDDQLSLWTAHQLESRPCSTRIAVRMAIGAPVDKDVLRELIQAYIDAHPMTRATIGSDADGRLVNLVHTGVEAPFTTLDATELDETQLDEAVTRFVEAPFPDDTRTLHRFALVRTAELDEFLWVSDHVISDGWSSFLGFMAILGGLAARINGEPNTIRPPRVTYATVVDQTAEWLASDEGDLARGYWAGLLHGTEPPRSLADEPADPDDVEQIVRIPEIGTVLDVEVLAERCSADVPDVLLAALQLVLGVSAGQSDVTVGTASAGRNLRNASVSGFMVRQTPVRTQLAPSTTFRELVRGVAEQVERAREIGDLPTSELTALAAMPPGVPLLRHGFGWQKISNQLSEIGAGTTLGLDSARQVLNGMPITARRVRYRGSATDLSLMAAPTSTGVQASFEFRTDRLHRRTVERLAGRLVNVLSSVQENPDLRLDEIAVLSDAERSVLDTVRAGPASPDHLERVDASMRRRVSETPDAIAVRCGDASVTYRELAQRVDTVEQRLVDAGVKEGTPVALCLPRSIEQIVGLYAILQARAVVVPVDPQDAAARVDVMLGGLGIGHSIGSAETAALLRETTVISAEPPIGGTAESPSIGYNRDTTADEALAAIYHTSGSTGVPKAVSVAHRGLANFTGSFVDRTGLQSGDRVLGIVPLHFDGSACHYFGAPTCGSTLVLATDDEAIDARSLRRLIDESDITWMGATPGMWAMLLDAGWSGSDAITGVYGGEAMPRETAEMLLGRLRSLWNSYGPTEASVAVTTGRVESGVGPIPLGPPIHGTEVRVVDIFAREAPLGTPGELWVTGPGLSPGYVGRPDLDQEVFVHREDRRWYRTGDEAVRHPDGQLTLGGRVDGQLNLRGFRIEPGDIEAALVRDPMIGQAVAVVRDLPGGRRMLCAYVTSTGEVDISSLRTALAATLPPHMIPTSITVLDALPLTANQKIDRAALPDPWTAAADAAPRRAASTDTERVLAAIWGETLDLEDVSIDADLFELGGDSITATRIAARVERVCSVAVSVRTVFDARTVATLAAVIDATADRSERPPIQTTDRSGDLALTTAQERMWVLQDLDPAGTAYSVPGAFRFRGPLEVERLRTAFARVGARHEALRTTFPVVNGAPVQRLHDEPQVAWSAHDHRGEHDPEQAAIDHMSRLARVPFDLGRGPLLRIHVHQIGDEEWFVEVIGHHIVVDQWALGVLGREIEHFYGDDGDLDPIEIQYLDVARWHQAWLDSGALDNQLDYWRRQLAGVPVLELPTDRPRPTVASGAGHTVLRAFPEGLIDRIRTTSRAHGASPYMVLLAGFQVLLHRLSGATDFAIGSPIAGRQVAESEPLIANMVNTLVIRAAIHPDDRLSDVIDAARSTALDAHAHQDVPFERLVHELAVERHAGRSPLFDVLFNAVNAPFSNPDYDGLDTSLQVVDRGAAQFDLGVSVDLDLFEAIAVEYRTELFDEARIERMLTHYVRILETITTDAAALVGAVDLLGADERELIDRYGQGPACEIPDVRLDDMVRAQAARTPEKTALRSADGNLSYGELVDRADAVGRELLHHGVGPGDVVGIHVSRGADMVVAACGIHVAGAAYLPLDPAFPDDRLQFMLDDSAAAAVVVNEQSRWRLDVRAETAIIDVAECTRLDGDLAGIERSNRDLAYVIYTSGSTGRPKGVELEHRSVVNFLQAMAERPGLTSDDVLLSVTTLSFDISVLEIWLPLMVGAEIVLASADDTVDPAALSALMSRHDVTTMQATPSTWRLLLASGWSGAGVRALCGGEPMPVDLARELVEACDELWNMYGPTETTIWSTIEHVTSIGSTVSIGRPIDNTTTRVLDPSGNVCPLGVPGELWIGGDGLARGYRARPELTADRFVTADLGTGARSDRQRRYATGDLARLEADGSLVCLGRIDTQVKVRGHRIELGEIEAELDRLPGVSASVAHTWGRSVDDQRLAAYVIPDQSGELPVEQLRAALASRLPDYMIPTTIDPVDEFPLTPNGKVDRKRLPTPAAASGIRGGHEPPRPGREAELAAIWKNVLDVDDIGRHDDFFELGGHSLLAVRIFAQIRELSGRRPPLTLLFRAPTIAGLAELLESGGWTSEWTSLVPLRTSGESTGALFIVTPFLISALSFHDLAAELGDLDVYALQPQGLENDGPIHTTVEAMADHYLTEILSVQPSGPYHVAGHCAGGWAGLELVHRLEGAGHEVASFTVVDVEPPGVTPPPRRWWSFIRSRVALYGRTRILAAVVWQLRMAVDRVITRRAAYAAHERAAHVREAHRTAHADYEGRVVRADLRFVRSEEWDRLPDKRWHLEWAGLTRGDFSVAVIDGAHARLLDGSGVRDLGEVLNDTVSGPSASAMSPVGQVLDS